MKIEKSKTKTVRSNFYLKEKTRKILSYRMQKFDGDYLFPQNDKDGAA
ncbi:MAG: hypothetical protein ABJA66_09740 [Actinomycetota bacterium]